MSPHTKQFIIQHYTTPRITTESELEYPLPITDDNFKPHNTVLIFDLNNVVFRTSVQRVIKELWECPQKINLFRLLFNFHFLYDLLSTVLRKKVIEQGIHHLTKKYTHFAEIQKTAFNVANAQKPMEHTVALLRLLKSHNYPIVAFSNLGTTSIEKLKKEYPHIFNLFDVIVHCSPDDGYIAKPSPLAFKKLFNQIDKQKKLILIDDSLNNIQQAYTEGIYGIPFISGALLKQTFIQLKII